jgi:DNA gyrase/topoisomerase IV subunit A
MKLRRLTGLDVEDLQNELAALKLTIEELTEILGSKKLLNNLIKKELTEVKKAHKNSRLSVIQPETTEVVVPYKSNETAYKEGVAILNANGTLKYVSNRGFGGAQRRAADSNADSVVASAFYANNKQTLLAVSNLGNCYKLSLDDLPERKYKEKGASLANINKAAVAEEKAVAIFVADTFPLGDCLIQKAVW